MKVGDARETEKAPDAFRTISEVADDLELPQHVLRFWETRFPQIRPVKRAGGRRFYRPEDVDLLRGIRHLLYTDGFTIKGAQRVLKDQGVRYVQDLGIEREVAVMRSAKPARGEEGEGVTFGGLLGLLPRRRPKARGAGDDAELPDLPEVAELPLPFPDPEADRDLEQEPDEPPMALRPAARGRATPPERRDPVFEPAPERRREPRLDEPPARVEPAPAPRQREAARRAPQEERFDQPRFEEPPFDGAAPEEEQLFHDGRRRASAARAPQDQHFDAPRFDRAPPADEPFHEARRREPAPRAPQEPRFDDRRLDAPLFDAPPPEDEPFHEGRHRDPARRSSQLRNEPAAPRARQADADDVGFSPAPAWPEPYAGPDRAHRPEEPRPARRERGERVEPVLAPQRPTRGPASRVESLGARPGAAPAPGGHGTLDDPLLPFFEDTPSAAPAVSEPIEARIQRLRAQERRPARPYEDEAHAAPPPDEPHGPPEEYIPARARRPVTDAEHPPAPPARPAPEVAAAPRAPRERLLQDGEWRQTDWVEAAWEQDPFAPPPARRHPSPHAAPEPHPGDGAPLHAPHPRGTSLPGRHAPEPLLAADDPENEMMEQERRRPPVSPPPHDAWREPAQPARAAARFAAAEDAAETEAYPPGYARHPAPEPQQPPRSRAPVAAPARTPSGPQAGAAVEQDPRRAWDEGWGENAPQALPRATRVGPLIGPILEEEPPLAHEVMPEDEQRRMAERMAGRPVAEPPAPRRPPPWVRPEPVAEPQAMDPGAPSRAEAAYAPEPPPAQRMPREPLRAGPPEQYLPPHLRSEPRVAGQPPMAAPVLSRDDVHRMQSALYELGECRRLMEGVLAGKDVRPAD